MVLTSEQMKEYEAFCFRHWQVSPETLMEVVASQAARELAGLLATRAVSSVRFVIGPGNNGADGLSMARHLKAILEDQRGREIRIYAPAQGSTDLWHTQMRRLEGAGLFAEDLAELGRVLRRDDVVVDAIFGIGLAREVDSPYAEAIRAIQRSGASVVALDVPSGLNASTGRVMGVAVRAQTTITFGAFKLGFFVSEGPEYCGRTKLIKFGLPPHHEFQAAPRLISDKVCRRAMPKRIRSGHKGTFGTVRIIGGSEKYGGALLLSLRAALRSGCGMVRVVSTPRQRDLLRDVPEVLFEETLSFGASASWVHVIGPGLDLNSASKKWCEQLAESSALPQVWDADGLNWLAEAGCPSSWQRDNLHQRVLTPHPGEAARLLGTTVDQIEGDRLGAARELVNRYRSLIVLKGHRTIVDAGARRWICPLGNSGLAKGGSGDVLAGFLGGLWAQGVTAERAAVAAVYLHARLSSQWLARGRDASTLIPSDLLHNVGELIHEVRRA